MVIWIIVDTATSILQIGFETKAAAEHYIKVHGNSCWVAKRMSVYSEQAIKEIFEEVFA